MSNAHNLRTSSQLESFNAARLLGREVEPPFDPLIETQKLAARSKRRTGWLAIATVLAWLVACGAAIWTVEIYFNEIRPQLPIQEYRYAQRHAETEGKSWHELTAAQQRDLSASQSVLGANNEVMMLLGQASIVLFGVAALLSVWLTIASRRTALRQINANLLSITLELKKLVSDAA